MIIDAELKKGMQSKEKHPKTTVPDLFWNFLRVKIFQIRKLQLAHIDLA